MTPALVMLGYAVGLAWLGPAPLAHMTARGVNARLGLAVWLVAVSSALASAVVAVSFLVRAAVAGWPTFAGTICRSVYGGTCPPQVYRSALFELSLAAASAVAVLILVTLTWQYSRTVRRSRRRAQEHAEAARITGRRFPAAGIPPLSTAVVLEADSPPCTACRADLPPSCSPPGPSLFWDRSSYSRSWPMSALTWPDGTTC